MPIDRKYLEGCLTYNVVKVMFGTRQGKVRIMYCTNNPEIIRRMSNYTFKLTEEESAKLREQDIKNDIIRVFDLQVKAFRSFIVSSVVSYEIYNGEIPKDLESAYNLNGEYDKVVDILNKNIVVVEFLKSDGSIRTMYCTRSPEVIKMYVTYESKLSKEEQIEAAKKDYVNGQVRVFDLQKLEWRSFLIYRVFSIEVFNEKVIPKLA